MMRSHLRRRTTRSGADTASAAEVFRALADPHRLALFSQIAGARQPICVCNLGEGLPLLQPTISHHLKVLKEAGLVAADRCGTWMYYRMSDAALERLRKHFSAATQQGWRYENSPITRDQIDRRKRGLLPKPAKRRTVEALR